MTHRVRSAFGRFLALGLAAAVALLLAASSLAAQGNTGKIEGTVTDQQGAPIASAQVTIVGTAFATLTNDKGYYFFNNVPAGSYTLRALFIGYTAAEVPGVRVRGDQTLTQNIELTPSAIAIGPVTIEAAANPLVPRDQVTSKTIIDGSIVANAPVDGGRAILALLPGVVESNNSKGVSIRGGRPGEAAVYIDGVLVRNSNSGESNLGVGPNAVQEASVTTGSLGAEFGEAQSGVISLLLKAGSPRYRGSLSYETDEPFGSGTSLGLNRVEASISGPVRGNLTFFVSGALAGQKTLDTQRDRDQAPIFVAAGVDTVVAQPVDLEATGPTDTSYITVPRFVQYSGECGSVGSSANANAQAIRDNYGVECQGLRLPFSASTNYALTGKLQYTYGSGSRVSLAGLGSLNQRRELTLSYLYSPSSQRGVLDRNTAAIFSWTHNLSRSAERALAFDVNVSYQLDKSITGPLTNQLELDSRNPFGGFLLSPFDFLVAFDTKHRIANGGDTTFADFLSDAQVNCLLAGVAACRDNVPFLDAVGGEVLLSAQEFRLNPYGVEQTARFPLFLKGLDRGIFLARERRWVGRANLDWQWNRFNRLKLGGDFQTLNSRQYSANMVSAFGASAYAEKPVRFAGYFENRLDLGDVVLVGGVRLDYYDSKAKYPLIPGRISSDPDSLDLYDDSGRLVTALATGTSCRPDGKFDAANPTNLLCRAPSHTAWSPRVQVSFPVTERTNFRLSYAHQVQMPEFDDMFASINTDLQLTNRNQAFGRDLDFGKTVIFEFGVRHAFSQDMVLDVSAYNKDKLSDVAGRLVKVIDPVSKDLDDRRVFTNLDFGNVRGVDVKLDRRFSNLFNGFISYTLQQARSTGSDPLSYFRTSGRVVDFLTGLTAPPPEAAQATDDNRTHNIAGAFALTFPGDWKRGTTAGKVLSNVGAFATFRFASGLPYTRLHNKGEGTLPGSFGLEADPAEPINASKMPWFKVFDLRVTKGFRVAATDWTLFADSRNLFNFRNVVSLFTETGDVRNAVHRDAVFIKPQVDDLRTEASSSNMLSTGSDGLPAVDFTAGCAGWKGRGGPVDCVALMRAESRYGDGNGTFEDAEIRRAFNAWYDVAFGPYRFFGPGRRIRLGVEVNF